MFYVELVNQYLTVPQVSGELLLGVLLVIAMGFIAYNKLNEKPERIAVVMADVDESHSAACVCPHCSFFFCPANCF